MKLDPQDANISERLWEISEAAYEQRSPWTKEQFSADRQQKHSHYLVDEAAFLGFHHVCDEIEITNIAVVSTKKRQGIGRLLMEELVSYAVTHAVSVIFLEVRASNTAARAFYDTAGFKEMGRRKNYYQHPFEDAVLMQLKVERKNDNK